MRALARLAPNERATAVAPFAGKVCRVTYRSGTYGKYDRSITGRVIGASYHSTNGNSTGDVVIAPAIRGNVWNIAGEQWSTRSIALVHVHNIEPIEE